MYRTYRAVKILITAPFLLAFLFLINLMTSPHHWWWQWAAFGIGIAWVMSLIRVLWALMMIGGLAGLAAYLNRRR